MVQRVLVALVLVLRRPAARVGRTVEPVLPQVLALALALRRLVAREGRTVEPVLQQVLAVLTLPQPAVLVGRTVEPALQPVAEQDRLDSPGLPQVQVARWRLSAWRLTPSPARRQPRQWVAHRTRQDLRCSCGAVSQQLGYSAWPMGCFTAPVSRSDNRPRSSPGKTSRGTCHVNSQMLS